jgi:hypothetical protein
LLFSAGQGAPLNKQLTKLDNLVGLATDSEAPQPPEWRLFANDAGRRIEGDMDVYNPLGMEGALSRNTAGLLQSTPPRMKKQFLACIYL